MLVKSLVLALVAAFLILFIGRFEVKSGTTIRQWLQTHSPKLISEMIGCDFCLSFWTITVLAVVTMPFLGVGIIIAPMVGTPVTRLLVG